MSLAKSSCRDRRSSPRLDPDGARLNFGLTAALALVAAGRLHVSYDNESSRPVGTSTGSVRLRLVDHQTGSMRLSEFLMAQGRLSKVRTIRSVRGRFRQMNWRKSP